ncbi:hypothetical protein FRC09_000912 [Ceratobasidium sp. 395]|nr:hypothetical protein FRC09_000912 [Ceratobasidium sp. 395]
MPINPVNSPPIDEHRLAYRASERPKNATPERAPIIKTKLFALIIGINAYPELKKLTGAVADAEAVQQFLVKDLNVPPDNINILLNANATRKAIIQGFKALRTDTRIQKSDPILIFFAGHGGRGKASPEWKQKYGYNDIQVLFPYNYNSNTRESTDDTNQCIPDTTVRGLLNDLAETKGNNITLILDSCYSASGDRTDGEESGSSGRIARDAEVEIKVPCDIDANVMSFTPAGQSSKEARVPELPLHTDQASHVLLAAAGSNQKAWEGSGRGDFTKVLLAGIRAGGAREITYEDLIVSLERLPGDQTPHCYGCHKSRILFNFPKPPRKSPFIPVDFVRDVWVLQAGSASGITKGSVWALYNTPTGDSQLAGYLQALEPGVSSTAFTVPQHGGSNPLMAPPPKRTSITRMYARQFQPGSGQELRVYFSREVKSLISSSQANSHTPKSTLGTAQGEIDYIPCETLGDAQVAVELCCPGAHNLGENAKVLFTLRSELARRYGAATLEFPTPAERNAVDRVLFAAARWHWQLKRTNLSSGSKSIVKLEFMKLGVGRGGHVVPLEGQLKNLVDSEGVVDIKVREEDQYGLKISSRSNAELYIRVFYFSTRDFSVLDMFGHTKANGRPDPDIPKGGQRVIGDEADGGSLLSFKLEPEQKLELGYIKVFWCTDPLELDDIAQSSPFDTGAYQGEGRAPIITTAGQWGAELITLVQRA